MPNDSDTLAPTCLDTSFDDDGHQAVVRDVTSLFQRMAQAEERFNTLIPQGARPGPVGPQGPSGSTGSIPAVGPSGQAGVSTALSCVSGGSPVTLYVWGYQ